MHPKEPKEGESLPGEHPHADIIAWARQSIKSPLLHTQVVADTPWSKVLKLRTQYGEFYLKQPAQDFYLEVDVIHACADLGFKEVLPDIVDENAKLHCFLMKAGGDTTVRDVQDPRLRGDLFEQSMGVYRSMQRVTAAHASRFLALGVPDWRLERLPGLYWRMVHDLTFMRAHRMDSSQVATLQRLTPVISDLTTELGSYKLQACLNQSDFHDNNVIWNHKTGRLCLIDLGESTMDHPFFSLTSTLRRFCQRHHIESGSLQYQRLQRRALMAGLPLLWI